MEGFGFTNTRSAVRKKRSNASRRPRIDSQAPMDYHDISSLSSTPPSDNVVKYEEGGCEESDEASNNYSYRGSNEQKNSAADFRRSSDGVPSPANWKGSDLGISSHGIGNENKVKKVKLKVGGIIRTINAKSTSDGASAIGSCSTRSSRFLDSQRRSNEDNLDDDNSFSSEKGSALQGVLWGDRETKESVRKGKRIPKKRVLDGMLDDDDDDDDEIQYLGKVKSSKLNPKFGADHDGKGGSKKHRSLSRVLKSKVEDNYDFDAGNLGSSRSGKVANKYTSGRVTEDTCYVEEEDFGSDVEAMRKRRTTKDLAYIMQEPKQETTITTRQRAFQSSKHLSSASGTNPVEFPSGLPPAPSKKQKEKLSEVEQQLKRAEALQRRRMQVEKAARESEAEAIRKILGQDSSRKKREDKIKKRQEELAQEKATNAKILASDKIRWVMGPFGTVVTFPNEMGFPSIFHPTSSRYPPPRENCAGPSCTNLFKYRDSESKLPLCSLQCYKAIREREHHVSAC